MLGDPWQLCYDATIEAGYPDLSKTRAGLVQGFTVMAGSLQSLVVTLYDENHVLAKFPGAMTLEFQHESATAVAASLIGDLDSSSETGFLTSNFTLKTVGVYTVHVSMILDGVTTAYAMMDAAEEPLRVAVVPGAMSNYTTWPAVGQPCLQEAQAGITCRFTAELKDAYGNIQSEGLIRTTMTGIEGPTEGRVGVVHKSISDTEATFVYTIFRPAGLYEVQFFVNHAPVNTKYPIVVVAGPAVEQSTQIEGPGVMPAGGKMSCEITFIDGYGNAGASIVGVVEAVAEQQMQFGECVDASANLVSQTFRLSQSGDLYDVSDGDDAIIVVAGTYAIKILVDGQALDVTSHIMQVTVLEASVLRTTITGSDPSGSEQSIRTVAGQQFALILIPMDKHGNKILDMNADHNSVSMQIIETASATGSLEPLDVTGTCGLYSYTFVINDATSETIDYATATAVNGEVLETVLAINVAPGALFGPATVPHSRESISLVAADSFAEIAAVSSHDRLGNALDVGGGTLCASIQPVSAAGDNAPAVASIDNLDGTYIVQMLSMDAGNYVISLGLFAPDPTRSLVDCDVQTLSDLVLDQIEVLPGATSAANTIMFGPGLSGGMANAETGFHLVASDKYGNIQTNSVFLDEGQTFSAEVYQVGAPINTGMNVKAIADDCGAACRGADLGFRASFASLAAGRDPAIFYASYT
jgi:hypothetical protein